MQTIITQAEKRGIPPSVPTMSILWLRVALGFYTVGLIYALLALSRKFIILDIHTTTPDALVGLAAITLALGATYWLMRDRNEICHSERSRPTFSFVFALRTRRPA